MLGHPFEKAKDAWLRRIKRDRGLPRNAFSVADEIARRFNRNHFRETGELIAWPSIPTIMDGTGLSRCTVMRMIEALDAAGNFAIEHGRGRRKFNRYRATEPAAENISDVRPFRASEDVSNRRGKRLKPDAENVSHVRPDLLKGPSEEPVGDAKASPYRQGERDAHEGARSIPPAAARAPEGGAAAGRGRGSKTDAGRMGADAESRELRAVWVRPWPDNDDAEVRREFARAIAEGADPREVIAAAAEWVRCADAPRFLPKLSKWLADRAFEKEPPQRRTRAATGERKAGGRSGKPRKPNLREMALKAGGYVEQPDGRLGCRLPNGSMSMWGGVR
jgi:hypothetical protein